MKLKCTTHKRRVHALGTAGVFHRDGKPCDSQFVEMSGELWSRNSHVFRAPRNVRRESKFDCINPECPQSGGCNGKCVEKFEGLTPKFEIVDEIQKFNSSLEGIGSAAAVAAEKTESFVQAYNRDAFDNPELITP